MDTKEQGHIVLDNSFSEIDLDQNSLWEESINSIVKREFSSSFSKETNVKNFTFSKTRNTQIKKYSNAFSKIPELNIKSKPKYINYITKSQNWIGHIIELRETDFTAKLEDLNNPTTCELAEFELDEVSKGDFEMLSIGALFYWSIGYATQNGQRIKQSLLRFKRSYNIKIEEFDNITDDFNSLHKNINWD